MPPAVIVTAVTALFPRKTGVFIGRGRFLGPRGQEELLEIKFRFCRLVHCNGFANRENIPFSLAIAWGEWGRIASEERGVVDGAAWARFQPGKRSYFCSLSAGSFCRVKYRMMVVAMSMGLAGRLDRETEIVLRWKPGRESFQMPGCFSLR